MKKRELEQHLREHGCQFLREGSSHSIWVNPATGHKEAIPRHTEVKKHLARKTAVLCQWRFPRARRLHMWWRASVPAVPRKLLGQPGGIKPTAFADALNILESLWDWTLAPGGRMPPSTSGTDV